MSAPSNGGPAFPRAAALIGGNFYHPEAGATLRDFFAAKAMGDYSLCGIEFDASDEELDQFAKHWYRIADSMLKARRL